MNLAFRVALIIVLFPPLLLVVSVGLCLLMASLDPNPGPQQRGQQMNPNAPPPIICTTHGPSIPPPAV